MPTIHFVRHITSTSTSTMGTDGLNALLRIRGVIDPQVIEESETHVIISYAWDANGTPPENLEAHFRAFGLERFT